MFLLLAGTYWIFQLAMLITIGELLNKVSHTHAVLIIGFYLLAMASKGLAEWLLYKKKFATMQSLQSFMSAQKQGNGDTNVG